MGGYVGAYTIWYGLLRRYRVDQVTPFILLMPIFGVVFAAALLGERLSWSLLGGGAVVLAGLFVVAVSPARAQPGQPSLGAPTEAM